MRHLSFLLILLLASACTRPDSRFEPTDQFIVDTTVIDVANASLEPGMSVVIRAGRIFAVEAAADIAVPKTANVLHRGGFVLPGLWDMHVHSLGDPDRAVDELLPRYIAFGVTGVRDMGSLVSGVVATREKLAADASALAPEIIAAGPLLDGVRLPWYGDLPLVLTDVTEVDEALSGLVEQGIDFFKVYDQLSPDVYRAILEFAAARNMLVAGHPPRSIGVTEAAASGQRTIEHLSVFTFGDCVDDPDAWFERALNAKFGEGGYSAYYDVVLEFFSRSESVACADAIQSLVANDSYLTPTLVMEMNDRGRVVADDIEWLEPDARSWCDTTLQSIDAVDAELREAAFGAFAAFTRRLHEAGVMLLAGSDNPNYCLVPGASLHWELERLVEAGLSPAEALATATINPAAALQRETSEGRILPGYHANLFVLEEDPLADIRNTRRIAGVVRGGQWVDAERIDSILAAGRQQD